MIAIFRAKGKVNEYDVTVSKKSESDILFPFASYIKHRKYALLT